MFALFSCFRRLRGSFVQLLLVLKLNDSSPIDSIHFVLSTLPTCILLNCLSIHAILSFDYNCFRLCLSFPLFFAFAVVCLHSIFFVSLSLQNIPSFKMIAKKKNKIERKSQLLLRLTVEKRTKCYKLKLHLQRIESTVYILSLP